jgi:hypothetical protein
MRKLRIVFVLVLLACMVLILPDAEAQCAMCRATIENNVSNGNTRIGGGLNTGILYLMSIPYIVFAAIAWFWYRQSKSNREKQMMLKSRLGNA